MVAFRQVLENCELSDLGFRGSKYTWSNCWDSLEFTKEMLDQRVANSIWRGLFPEVEVVVENIICSDHAPLILCLLGEGVSGQGPKRFRYEASWRREEGYYNVVTQAWVHLTEAGSGWQEIDSNFSRCKRDFVVWQRGQNGLLQENITRLKKRLHDLQGREEYGVGEETKTVKRELELLLEKSDLQWR